MSLERQIKEIDRKVNRINQNEQCDLYLNTQKDLAELTEKKLRLSEEIEESQSQLLEEYFDKINTIFQQLGSENFTLVKNVDNRGNKKVYSLNVQFKNNQIRNDQLSKVFSESDRRALALSIFLSKINTIESNLLNRMIIIFDDPVTSFDENRITKTINLFKNLVSKVNQIIILTHYPKFVLRFLEISKRQSIDYKIFQIKLAALTSEIIPIDESYFFLDEYEKKFMNIYNFINRIHENDIKSDLRPFLESHLKKIFKKQIIDFNINPSNLDDLINLLFDNDVISEDNKDKLHEFRITLNPDSHIITSNNPEDVRSFAREVVDFLHSVSFNG